MRAPGKLDERVAGNSRGKDGFADELDLHPQHGRQLHDHVPTVPAGLDHQDQPTDLPAARTFATSDRTSSLNPLPSL